VKLVKKKRPAPAKAPPAVKAPAPKPAAKKPARRAEPIAAEHRVTVASVALAVSYGRDRSERMELRGAATLNANGEGGGLRTTGLVVLTERKGAKIANRIAFAPASLNRNLVLSLFLDEADLALFRALFVTGTGPEAGDPAVVFWARTVEPLKADAAATEAVIEFGFRLDFDPGPVGMR